MKIFYLCNGKNVVLIQVAFCQKIIATTRQIRTLQKMVQLKALLTLLGDLNW